VLDLTLDTVLKVANFALAMGAIIFAWFGSRREKVDDQIEGLEGDVTEIRQGLAAVRARVDTMPSRDELHELDRALAVNQQRLVGIEETTQRTNRMVERIENFLLKIGEEK